MLWLYTYFTPLNFMVESFPHTPQTKLCMTRFQLLYIQFSSLQIIYIRLVYPFKAQIISIEQLLRHENCLHASVLYLTTVKQINSVLKKHLSSFKKSFFLHIISIIAYIHTYIPISICIPIFAMLSKMYYLTSTV